MDQDIGDPVCGTAAVFSRPALADRVHSMLNSLALSNTQPRDFIQEQGYMIQHLLMVKLERMRDRNLKLGIVTVSLSVQMYPDTGHCKRMRRMGLVNIRHGNTLRKE